MVRHRIFRMKWKGKIFLSFMQQRSTISYMALTATCKTGYRKKDCKDTDQLGIKITQVSLGRV